MKVKFLEIDPPDVDVDEEGVLRGSGQIQIDVELPNVLRYLAQQNSSTELLAEQLVQNALDAQAQHIAVVVDLKQRKLLAYDDGVGTTQDEIELKLKTIGRTLKPDEFLGGKGTGILAPISIMSEKSKYRLVTSSKDHPHQQLVMEINEDLLSKGMAKYSHQQVQPLTYRDRKYNTCVIVSDVELSFLKSLSRKTFEGAADHLSENFATTLSDRSPQPSIYLVVREGKIDLENHKIEPREFDGTPEEPIIIETESGPITMELFTTEIRRKRKDVKLFITHKRQYDLPFKNFDGLSKDAKAIWLSGFFMGRIHIDFSELIVNRGKFKEGKELETLAAHLEEFAFESLNAYVKLQSKSKATERIQRNIKKAAENVSSFLDDNIRLVPDSFLEVREVSYGEHSSFAAQLSAYGDDASTKEPKPSNKARGSSNSNHKKRNGKGPATSLGKPKHSKRKGKAQRLQTDPKNRQAIRVTEVRVAGLPPIIPVPYNALPELGQSWQIAKGFGKYEGSILLAQEHELYGEYKGKTDDVFQRYIHNCLVDLIVEELLVEELSFSHMKILKQLFKTRWKFHEISM